MICEKKTLNGLSIQIFQNPTGMKFHTDLPQRLQITDRSVVSGLLLIIAVLLGQNAKPEATRLLR